MRPVCVKCRVEMSCKKNGFAVAPKDEPTWVYHGDKFTCPSCGDSVVVGFGQARTETEPAELLLED